MKILLLKKRMKELFLSAFCSSIPCSYPHKPQLNETTKRIKNYLFCKIFVIVFKIKRLLRRDSTMISILFVFVLFAVFILFYINKMTDSLCIQKDIPEDKHAKIFRTINILVTILLISSFIEILYS